MIIFEFIAQAFIEFISIELIGGLFSSIDNFFLRLRGIPTKSVSEIKLEKLNKRYLYKKVKAISNQTGVSKGDIGVVMELIDHKRAFVEFENKEDIIEISLKKIILV